MTTNQMPAIGLQQVTPATPMEMLSRAMMSGATPDVLEKLLALQERWENNQARKAFDEAIAAARAEIPPIKKNKNGVRFPIRLLRNLTKNFRL